MTRTTTRLTLFASAACIALVTSLFLSAQQNLTSDLETTAFVCPMHPDYTLEIAGRCPRCGMALVKATPYDVRDYGFEFTTTPALVQPGRSSRWRFAISHPGTGQKVTTFESVHERQYHLFVISQDMEHFQHIHPEQQADGTWAIDVTLPKAGYYMVLSDFLPSGGAAQLISRPLVTAGYAGDLTSGGASLVLDANPRKTIDDITATVSYDPPTFVAGLYGHLIFDLTDTQTGRPITDLQTYLGAFGHTLIMSEDMLDYVHTHPLDILASGDDDSMPQFVIPPGADLEKIRGGPQVIFDGLMPKPGRYRAWTQVKRNNRLYTFTSTFVVAPTP